MEWQPIETAPRDGRKLLGYDPTILGHCIAYWYRMGWHAEAESQDGMGYDNIPLTHWQPLTLPPNG